MITLFDLVIFIVWCSITSIDICVIGMSIVRREHREHREHIRNTASTPI